MKLHNLELVEMKSNDDNYIYIYAVLAKSFFKKKYLKFIFNSDLPHYWWTEIQKVMTRNNLYFEDLTENEPVDLEIGTFSYSQFSDKDLSKYGTTVNGWRKLRKEAVVTQRAFVNTHNEKHGEPDLSHI